MRGFYLVKTGSIVTGYCKSGRVSSGENRQYCHRFLQLEDYRNCVRIYVQYFCDWRVGVEAFNFYKFHLEPLKPSNCELEIPCPLNEFQCSNGACIPDVSACDGHTDCDDASDENRCELKSSRNQEIGEQNLNCRADGGAEVRETIHWFLQRPVPQCNQNQFECGYKCVDKTKVCAGNKRCGRRSVEKACVVNAISNSTCKDDPTEYRAMLESVPTLCTPDFLHPPKKCRKLKDYHWCIYEAVRRRCGYRMAYHAYKLSLFRHTSSQKRYKCPNIGSCYHNQLMCRGRRECVRGKHICDGRQDCEHGEDEENCGAKEIWLVGENSQPRLGEKFTMKCAAKVGAEFRSVAIQWYLRRSGESEKINIRDKLASRVDSLYGRARIDESRSGTRIDSYLKIDSVRLEDGGDYFCTSGTLKSPHYKLRVLNTGAFFQIE
ncbi:low-density lipoprotein receptor-related protein [Elysia marginata]|uniref:Low-density lipoprotein receptor-related protein n=1 Tax=Elysia marginata TaxID=1093978 RepID=A0AAV4GS81_9GAST|nr:low-density lipoprotein receptor-related protein [Elysia marginata]